MDWELQGGKKAEGWKWGGYTEKWDGLAREALAGGDHSLKPPAQITWRLTGVSLGLCGQRGQSLFWRPGLVL